MLSKYHKYKLNKKRVNQLKSLAERFDLPYDPKQIKGYLLLTVFEEGLKNKTFIESYYEDVRNQCYDMWNYLSFNERNELILRELKPQLTELKHFEYNNEQIYIPFFDELMNALYSKEVAILELPQFFELYQNFNGKIIPINHYELRPLIANMSEFDCTLDKASCLILHDSKGKAFIKVEGSDYIIYPYLKDKQLSEPDILTLSIVLSSDDEGFYHALIEKEAVSKRFTKKYHKKLKKQQKKVKS